MDRIPDFFWAHRLTLVAYYGYPSSVRDRFFEISIHGDDAKEKYSHEIQRFNDLKRKCMSMFLDMRWPNDPEPAWRKDIWDNKVVIECKTESGGTIYVGYYDFTYSIGVGIQCRDSKLRLYKTELELKEVPV